MGLFDGIKKAVSRITNKDTSEQEGIQKWRDKFANAKSNWDYSLADDRECLYNGSHDVDANINATASERANRKMANNVVNIVYELIESAIDTTIPQPSVKSKMPLATGLAKTIEDSIKNDLIELDFDRVNDENERTTCIQGMSITTLAWNPDKLHHLYSGELQVDNHHPKAFIGQPGVYRLQPMDYFFLLYSMTKGEVKSVYGKALGKSEAEQYPEVNVFHDGQSQITGENDKVTVIVCWFKEDGIVGKFVWCNDTVLQDLPDFYARRLQRCTKCGAIKGDSEECQNMVALPEMEQPIDDYSMDYGAIPEQQMQPDFMQQQAMQPPEMGSPMDMGAMPGMQGMGMPMAPPEPIKIPCGNKKYKESIEDTEILAEDIKLAGGQVIPAGTEVPYFKPTRYPVVLRKNVPVNFQLAGQSDVDVIRDQADAIKKIVSRLEEKIIRGAGIITALEDHQFNLTNELYQIVRGNQSQLNALNIRSLTDDVFKELEVVRYMYEAARNTLGITNSWQGKADTTAKSGVAKQIQVQQSGGRMQSKIFNKYGSYKEVFKTMFELKLACYDELRPFMAKDATGNVTWGDFDKYQFLQQDASGEWYYNTDFLFEATVNDAFPRDRMWVMQQALLLYQNNAMDPIGLWTVLESINFPYATELKQMAVQKQQAQAQNPPPQDKPKEQISFKDLPPEGQQQMAAQAGIKLDVQSLAQQQVMQQQPQQGQQQPQQPPQGGGQIAQ